MAGRGSAVEGGEGQDGLQFVPAPRGQVREELRRVLERDYRRYQVLSDRGAIRTQKVDRLGGAPCRRVSNAVSRATTPPPTTTTRRPRTLSPSERTSGPHRSAAACSRPLAQIGPICAT